MGNCGYNNNGNCLCGLFNGCNSWLWILIIIALLYCNGGFGGCGCGCD